MIYLKKITGRIYYRNHLKDFYFEHNVRSLTHSPIVKYDKYFVEIYIDFEIFFISGDISMIDIFFLLSNFYKPVF